MYPNDAANWTANPNPSPGTGERALADADSDGMPDSWEIFYFGSTNAINGEAEDDWDQDGACNYDEFGAGTIPTDDNSVFTIVEVAETEDGMVVSWTSEPDVTYALLSLTSLSADANWTLVASGITARPPLNSYTDHPVNQTIFYCVIVEE